MTFLHISMLLGAVAALAPVMLHMLGARQPRSIAFPAVRFVRQTAITAQRGWNVKRWLLLLLRTMLILGIVFALASPRVHSSMYASYIMIGVVSVLAILASAATAVAYGARKGLKILGPVAAIALTLWGTGIYWLVSALNSGTPIPVAGGTGPISAAIIVDTSPTMAYRYHNATRIDEAKQMARWLMDRLPIGSQIAIVGSDSSVRLNVDRVSAERQLDRVTVEGRATNLISRISASIDAVRRSELERREVYVLTDFRARSWNGAEQSDIPTKLVFDEKNPELNPRVLVQLIDIGAPNDETKDWMIRKWKLGQESTVPGGQVSIEAEIQSTPGSGTEQLICELAVETFDSRLPTSQGGKVVLPSSKVVDRQLVQVPDGGSAPVKMLWKDLAEGTNHAELRIVRPDPLDLDNVTYLTAEARSQGQTLVLSDDARDGQLVSLIVDPQNVPATAQKEAGSGDETPILSSAPTVEPFSRIPYLDLSKFSNAILYNPSQVDPDDADRLLRWVDGGGGLLAILGPAPKNAEAIAQSGLAKLIPGQIKRQTRRALTDRSIFLNPVAKTHPIWSIFERPIDEIPWINYAIFRHWDIEALAPEAIDIMRFTESDLPAILEWPHGQGRIIVSSLPYPEPSQTAAAEPWSELYATSSDAWPGFALYLGTIRYLASQNKHPVNYTVESTAILDNNTANFPKVYELFTPNSEVVRVDAVEEQVSYAFTKQPGQYRLKGLRRSVPVVRGFSANVDREEIQFERVAPGTIEQALGKSNFLVAKDKSEVQSSIGAGRHGRELSPFLLVIVVMMVMAEQTMSSRFYASTTRGNK